ncbi:MAG: helix-turn-helix transcriptional regulator [Erysipelotrichaceae bacterium]|jgi:DNA-binding HxlR family transcriptional regulator|nr:helix-turn-helix transcriptional regulator [Erysipelotrichaceae bacterium]
MKVDYKLCPKYEKVFKWLGKRWNGLILRCLLDRPMRFTELAGCLQSCSDKVLTERLKELETEGLIVHVDSHYQLTQLGYDLNLSLNSIQSFADKNL